MVAKGLFPDDFSTADFFRYTFPFFNQFLYDEVINMVSNGSNTGSAEGGLLLAGLKQI